MAPLTLTRPKEAAYQRIRLVANLLDNSFQIPGTQIRFGIDPIIGLFPAAGDWIGGVLSMYIVLEALRFKLPAQILFQMVWNVLLETVIGTIPALGDLFDLAFRANLRNLKLLETHLHNPRPQKAIDSLLIALVILIVVAFLVAITSLVFWVASSVLKLIWG